MIKISIITVFPELYENFVKTSLINRAVEQGFIEFNFVRFSDMCQPKERIDEPTVGHGAGMIIKPEVIQKAIERCEEKWGLGLKIFFSPQGHKLEQHDLADFYMQLTDKKSADIYKKAGEHSPHIILVCSRYEGIDARVEEYYADIVLSIGDYVLMGGDLPAQVFLEGLLRLFPGVVGKAESVKTESFQGPFLDHPEYGHPVDWNKLKIPEILRSGNHKQIDEWRREQACKKTILNRFDWLRRHVETEKDIELSRKFIPPHYVVIMHSQIVVAGKQESIAEGQEQPVVGNSSVASIDIHDIARSCATYGIKNFFIVTQLEDQFKIVNTFLSFWHSERGKNYNPSRFQAVECVIPTKAFQNVLQEIKIRENAEPLIITTSAKNSPNGIKIDFSSQGLVWKHNRPVLIVFGTGQGLSNEIMEQSNFILTPVKGLTDYNHLSVRSAAAIVLDRWLGLNPMVKTYGRDRL